ncbi:MAG TPA: 2-isopropylmalate synthase [Gaiellaceae bacterium]|nr:2-isopropylmalate synthase [Gaiellaceae bacterium]
MSSRRITIFDTTLRDGEQAPGIALRPDEKVEIGEQLEWLGVDVIEAGFAASSPGDFEGVRAVALAAKNVTVASLCRSSADDIDAAAAALADAPRSRIHIFLATSALHMEKKLRLTPDEVVVHASTSVARACASVDEVEFSCEDATRSDPEFVATVCRAAVEAGATTINLPDTVGYMLPNEYAAFISHVRELCPEIEDVALSAHCHDDLGLAVANSLAAIDAGVQQLECTINGIGERAGNASLEEIVMAMRVRGDALHAHTEIDLSQIGPASRLVERLTRYPVPPNKAIVGANAFAHEAGIHQDGLLKDVATYQIIDPGELGLAMTLPLGKHSGRHAFFRACAEAGLGLEEEELVEAFARFKARADEGGAVSISELVQEVRVS